MRFRARMVDSSCIKQFMSILSAMSKLGKTCALRITNTALYFIIHETQSISSAPQVWCEVEKDHLFLEYNMEGISEEDNEILLEFDSENIARVSTPSRVTSSAKAVKMKLTKKRVPCLTFEIDLPSETSRSRVVVHNIPVNLISHRLWDEYREPPNPSPDITILLPPMKMLKNIVERMKHLANMGTLYFNKDGNLSISVDSSMVSVASRFSHLQISSHDLKKLATFLAVDQLSPNRVVCSGVSERFLHFSLFSDSFNLRYILPAVSHGG